MIFTINKTIYVVIYRSFCCARMHFCHSSSIRRALKSFEHFSFSPVPSAPLHSHFIFYALLFMHTQGRTHFHPVEKFICFFGLLLLGWYTQQQLRNASFVWRVECWWRWRIYAAYTIWTKSDRHENNKNKKWARLIFRPANRVLRKQSLESKHNKCRRWE